MFLLRKVYNFLKMSKRIAEYFLCQILVFFNFPNSYAFFLVIKKIFRNQLMKNINSLNFDKNQMHKIYDKIITLQNKAINANADEPNLYLAVATASLITGKTEEYKLNRLKYLEKQKTLTLSAQEKGFDFQIIEPGLVAATIGTSINLDAWIKSRILGFQKKNPLILPFPPVYKNKITNRCMLDYYRPYIDIIEDPKQAKYYYSFLKDLMCVHDVHIPCGDNIVPFTHSSAVYVQSIWDKQGRKPLFKLTEEHKSRGNKILKDMGLPNNAWFVTCHVRESKFKGKEGFRDSDISTYFKAFKEIVKQGGWVIRVGDKSMRPLPKIPQVIDYAVSEYKSDWMDIFLLAAPKFMLGTSSGPATVSYVFGVPIAMTNYLPTATTYLSKRDLFLPRLMQRKDDGKMLGFKELMTLPYSLGITDGMYDNVFRIKTIPNTETEIKLLCSEMLEKLQGSVKYSQEDEKLQKIFKTKTAEKEVMIGFPNFPIQCRIGKDFLNYHKELIVNV